MSTWTWILIACAIAFATKLVGYLLPHAWLEQPRVQRTAAGMTVGLLASLVAVNTFVSGTALVFDARVAAFVAAAIALLLRAPFLVVVLVGALATAGARALGF
ncbi:MAG TPA: AzlD domain-containing protein [Arachnia sp.]|nr:AzlD domain-containing protein [Arachnia sp.]HMT85831.1 AzlD domain-containing protein [Arachnia sp.]